MISPLGGNQPFSLPDSPSLSNAHDNAPLYSQTTTGSASAGKQVTNDDYCGTKPRPTPWPPTSQFVLPTSYLGQGNVFNSHPLSSNAGGQVFSPFDTLAINPQPLPPGARNGIIFVGG